MLISFSAIFSSPTIAIHIKFIVLSSSELLFIIEITTIFFIDLSCQSWSLSLPLLIVSFLFLILIIDWLFTVCLSQAVVGTFVTAVSQLELLIY